MVGGGGGGGRGEVVRVKRMEYILFRLITNFKIHLLVHVFNFICVRKKKNTLFKGIV